MRRGHLRRVPERCELCAEALGDGGHDRVGGVALCRRCFLGDVRRVAAARGWTLWSDHAQYSLQELDESTMHYRTEVRIVLPGETRLALLVQRRTWWRALLGLFKGRARSRDPLFEQHVRMWTHAPASVEEFIREEGVESSVMEVLGNILSSWVKIRGGTLEVYYVADDPHTEGELVARSCVLAHHLARLGTGAPVAEAEDLPEPAAPSVYGAPRRS